MVDIMDVYKSLNIRSGTATKNPEMLKFVPDHLKTQQMCDKAIIENGGTLKSVPDCYKNQEMCNKAVDNYPHVLEFVPECCKTQNMCDKAVDTYPSTKNLFLNAVRLKKCVIKQSIDVFFVFNSVPGRYINSRNEDPFLIIYSLDKYKCVMKLLMIL